MRPSRRTLWTLGRLAALAGILALSTTSAASALTLFSGLHRAPEGLDGRSAPHVLGHGDLGRVFAALDASVLRSSALGPVTPGLFPRGKSHPVLWKIWTTVGRDFHLGDGIFDKAGWEHGRAFRHWHPGFHSYCRISNPPVPEPSTALLLAGGLVLIAARGRRGVAGERRRPVS